MKTLFLRSLILIFILAHLTHPRVWALDPERTCSGPVTCGENVSHDMGSFFGNLTQDITGQTDMISESELKEIELKLGKDASTDMLTFDSAYADKMGVEAPTSVTRAFMQYRMKLNIRNDRNIDFVNTNENKSLGLSGPESKPKDMVDVELPANTKPKPVRSKIKKPGRPESN